MRPVSPVRLARLRVITLVSMLRVPWVFVPHMRTKPDAVPSMGGSSWSWSVKIPRGLSENSKDNGRLRRKSSLPCETIPPSPFHLSMSTEMAPIGHQHNSCDHYSIPLTLYWLRTRSTVVSFGSNLKTCFKSAGPRTASSRAQSISTDPHTSGRLGA